MSLFRKALGSGIYLSVFGAALIAHAQTSAAPGPTFADAVNKAIVPFFNSYVIPLLYSLSFLVFMFGAFRYFFTGGEENRQKGKAFLLWGIICMVLIFSLWGVVNLLLSVIPT